MPWKIVSCSVTGISHKRRSIPCQDFAGYYHLPEHNAVIGAVADGAGSAKYSHKGSRIAVKEAIAHTKENLKFLLNREKRTEEFFSGVLDMLSIL